jgi:amino acid adenylation domain-containing protein
MEQLSTTMNHLVAQGTPLSSGQMRLWFLDQLDLVDSAYNSIHEIDFGCRIDPETLRMAIRQIIQRHEVLRTYFQVVGDRVVQVISPSFEAELPVLDLHDLPSAERAGRVKAEISELCRRPFDLRQLPLFRTLLVRPGPDKDILLLQLHHIIADGQSSLVLLKELSAIYHAGRLGMPSAGAPRLPVQYSDYALWEQEWLLSKASTKQLSYWREQLKDPPPPLELPADELHVESPNAGVVSFELPEPMVLELKRLARQEKVTLFMFLLAAFQCLLYRYTGGPDIIIGSPVAGRIRPEFENLIGFFVNTVALRTRIAGEETFRDLLTRVRAICLRAYGNQEFPFDRIVEELHPDRRLDSTPIFQVMLSLNRISKAPMEGTTWSFRSLATEDQRPQFDLLLAFFETESEVAGTLTYRSSIFRRATMDRLVGHFQEFIRQVSANVETSIDAVQILTEDERRRLLYDLNATESIYPGGKCLHELFEDQVERAPQATALVSGTQRIDYRELNQKAGRLASYLQCLGVGPEVRVGICLKRSPEIIVSILAVLKAGGAYVPLDPAYPAERLAFMASDSGLKVLIAGGMIPKSLSEQVSRNGSRIVVIDDESTWSSESLPSLHVAGKAVPSNLAYIIYTSGSTGVPKGVSIEHRNAVNFIRWALSVFSPEDLAHTVASTSVCFDLSIFEIFAPLSCGGEILLVENALQLKAEIGELQVSLINTVPSVMQELLYMGSLPSLRTLNLAGEPFTGALLQRIREANLTTRIFNLYGPSETTTYSSFARAGNNVNRAVPIGRPVGNTQCYVLDRLIEPVPVGVAGELYIGGQGVSRGYLGRPELTAERFIPDPFAKEAGRRLYKTGDLVRYRMTGDLEFVGRIDHQVKIRGFRIELGEIEAALLEHASVREAIVVARQERDGDKRLVAYVVREQREEEESEKMVDDGLEAATETLRRYLNRKLPSHMIPGRLVFLKSLPLTPNGKVDRDRLPEPEISCAGNARLYLAPRTSTEQTIADIWSELLSGQQISVDQSFFELGGHSLLAARAVLRMREVFGIEIPFRLIFEHPDVAGLARQFSAGLGSAFQSVPLERQGREGRGAGEEFVGCYVFGASYGQQRLWFLHELNELSGVAYHVCGGLKLEGAVSREQMAEGLNRVVARHESLRTRLALVEGELSQIIEPELRLEMGYEDIRSRGAKGEEERLGEIRAEVAERRFDLRTGPLVRASLVRVEEEVYQLMMAAHHIICDGWSVNVFIGDLMEEYRGLVEGDGGRLEELKLQYADFAVWQRKWLESGEAAWEMEYWKEKLGGEAPLVNLPLDGVRPVMQSFRGGTEEVVMGRELGERLRGQGRAAGATMYMTLLSGFKVLLHKYGQGDIWVGTPVANRLGRELEGVVGFFVNTLVMRTKLESELRFGEVLERVRETVAGGYGHQQLPFEKLVQELHPQRQLSTTPLFQVMFLVEAEMLASAQVAGLSILPVASEMQTAKFDLTLFMAERAEGLVARLEYNRDLFEGSTIRRMLGHLGGLLEKIGREPERRLCELSLLTEEERRQIVEEWNATEAEYPQRCLQELFEEQAGRAPEAIAVAHGARQWSYGELNRRANRLAHYLQQRGVGPEMRVGIFMQRSLEMIAGLLGVLKAGGAYVPLDPGYPRERLEWMLEDGQVEVLLSEERLQEQCRGRGTQLICMEQEWEQIERQSDQNPVKRTDVQNLAYVIYTSGSTGRPKGVAVTHHSANVMVHWAREVFTDEELAGVLASTSICFDLSIFEIFVPLSWGGKVLLAENALELAAMVGAEQVRLINTVPSAIVELLRMKAVPSSVRTVNLAGEALQRNLVEQVYAMEQIERVLNLYGPSEDTTYSTYEWVKAGAGGEAVSIGRPIANTKVYVLDAALEAVPVGVAGELCIGGEGQARGYLNRAELTAECFVPDPHSRRGGQRMYRTGDLARWKAEGSLEFLGRIDHQVKIRGYRIEMGEIESGLMQQDGIDQAVVVVHGSAADQRLVAYVVAQDGATELNIGALRENLRKKVPGYMVPETIVQLAELPLTFNGKVDRKKLPEPERDRDQSADYVGPRNAEEEILCGIFAEVLKLESVGTEDDFFQMGGHSLLATQVVSRIRSTFGVELPLRDLFEAPTVASVAERIKVARGVSRNGAPPLVAMKREGVVPLSYGQHRLWFIDQLEPGNPAYNIAFGVRLKGELEREGLCWSLNEIVRRHESLRTSFPLRDGNPVQEITAASVLLVEEVNLPGEPEEDCQTRVLAEARREAGLPFDLGRGPLLRVKLLRVEEQDHVLLVTMHHIVSDGWSISVMMREFMQLYQAWLKKEESSLPELKVQYADYTLWQREWLRGEVLERELAYWREQLADVPVLELPVDNPRPALMSYRGDTVKVVFSTELTESLKQLSRRQGVTLFMSMLAVFQMVLGRYAGQEDVAVGTGIANRNRRETEGLIGFFVNTLVLRTQLSGNLSFIDLLKRVQQVTLAAYQHQDMPFEKLVDGLHPERDLSRTPLFQAMLMFQNLRMPELQLPGLRVSEFNIEAEVAKFDVMLTLQENGGTLNGELSYARDLYEAATMERLVGHVAEVLKRMVERPDVWIGEVSLLTHTERRQIVEEWNATATEYPQGCQLQELIEQQVERSPEALAVIYEGQRLSYRELNERANQLGCYLREQGVGSDVRVAICLERSVEMVVGLLGIMKAAGAYVPLDPDYPEERLKYMLADTQPTLLLTQERMQARLAGLGSVRALCLDRDWAAIAERPVTNLRRIGSVDDLAYVIYTSGSTGQPKGAMIPHRGIVNRLIWMQEQYQLTGEDRVLQKTPFSFDVSVWEFFWPLLTGAGLVVCQPGRHGDSRYLVELIEKERVTTLHFVPSMLSQFLEDPEVEKCVSLRQVICSGEALPATVQEHFFTRMNAELHNLYGPTEASVDVTYWKCLRGEGDRAVPIGRPIANTQMYVLDQHLNALPVGVKGDLYIGGVGLGRGYQNRPELTADKFIPDSLGTEAGQRLYKTGDLARYRADGSLGFLGRGDFQVKVRGFRIELGEIEGALQSHEGIREAVVVARKSREGDHRLVAYLVASGESAPGINELRSYLLERLPSYMVPAQFITLAQMPLGKNGKVDRKALPEAGKERPEIEEQYVEASTAEEKVLAEVWRQVLGVERVGVHDNFFTLGGDSIRSLQVITKARAQRLQITLQQLFRTPTIHGLAAHSQWSAEPVAPAEQPRPFDLIADNDRAKLQALLSRKNSSRQIDEKEICPA